MIDTTNLNSLSVEELRASIVLQRKEIDRLRAQLASRGGVPDGWKLVIPLTERMPDPDKHPRVVVYTEEYDFQGEQFFDVDAESLNENYYADPADQPEVCRYATHWIGANVLACLAVQAALDAQQQQEGKANGADATQRIDAALDLVLRAAGSSIAKHHGNLYAMRNAMRKIMGDAYIQGSSDCHKAMMENIKNVWLADELSAGAAPTGGEA